MTTPTDRSRPFAYRLAIAIIRPLLLLFTRREWSGAENLPTEGGYVVCPNHYSYLDPLVFGHFLVDHGHAPRYLGKIEVFEAPVVGRIVRGRGPDSCLPRVGAGRGRVPGGCGGGAGRQGRGLLSRGHADP